MSSIFSLSLGKKITMLSVIPVIIGIFALVFISVSHLDRELYAAAAKANEDGSNSMSDRASGAVKFRQKTSFEKLVDGYYETSNLMAVRAWIGETDVLFESTSPNLSTPVLEELSRDLENGTRVGNHQIYVQPIMYGKGDKRTTIGYLATAWDTTEIADKITNTKLTLIYISAAVLLFVIAIMAYLIRRSVSAPIQKTTTIMSEIAGGNLDIAIEGKERKDEIGSMIQAVEVFKHNSLELRRAEAEQEETRRKAEETKRADMNRLATSFEESVKSIVNEVSLAIGDMTSGAQRLSETAGRTNQTSGNVATASAETTANVQTVASASEELSRSIQEISRKVVDSSNVTSEAVQQVETTNEEVGGLSEAARKIGDVIDLISDIAEQTNLLALNATIEAARAGDAGKGFAVVASEVKNLATQTAKATEEIGEQIGAMQTATEAAVDAIRSIGSTIAKVDEIASSISAAVEQQGAATQEISRSIQEAADSTQRISTSIDDVSSSADQTGQSAESMKDAASHLTDLSDKLHGEVDTFLREIKTA
ncbi:methyl-accepting chemotaxis protein [Denitrobaculum tricleocarpae]|uniref:HAMP domain-containing protein n=1 Tax=Denitrobaculum tricleocarpae TaxID=2591009 RepID=A0A545TXR1_9PROT|nr:methyl-accepting chemotaxis protein [Denitrobaculum tricleocarpae]TQV81990.1 HAMP domain-containing protein [Denitrobaculum tricleocarpae]